MKYVITIFVAIFLLAISFCIGATKFQGVFNGIKWTDIGSLIVTFLGFTFAFITYFQWLKNKRKEDAYLVAKKYVASIDEIEEQLHELIYQYGHICPAPGVVVENNDVSLKRIEHLHNVWGYLYQARRNLFKSHRELAFWNVNLVSDFKEHHNAINKSLDEISVVSSALNNQLFHYIKSEMKNMGEVISHKKRFDVLFNQIHNVIQKRVECGFKDMFKFGEQIKLTRPTHKIDGVRLD